jgi:hypothetical protein
MDLEPLPRLDVYVDFDQLSISISFPALRIPRI